MSGISKYSKRTTKRYPKEAIRTFHNILIIEIAGEWFDRYYEFPPYRAKPDAIVDKHFHLKGSFDVWRAPGVSEANWQAALKSLRGEAEYD